MKISTIFNFKDFIFVICSGFRDNRDRDRRREDDRREDRGQDRRKDDRRKEDRDDRDRRSDRRNDRRYDDEGFHQIFEPGHKTSLVCFASYIEIIKKYI